LEKLGFSAELERTKIKKVRAGVGKTRGRRYKKKVGPLIVTAKKAAIVAAAQKHRRNHHRACKIPQRRTPRARREAGRLTIWTKSAIENSCKKKTCTIKTIITRTNT